MPKISKILDGEAGCADNPNEVTLRHLQDVLNHLFRRGDLLVAVMPGKFDEFQQIKNNIGAFS